MRIPLASAVGATRVDGGVDHRRQVDRAAAQAQLSRDHARDVEQILDEAGLSVRGALELLSAFSTFVSSSTLVRSNRSQRSMALSGVRRSCETMATNSSLARFAASASLRRLPRMLALVLGALALDFRASTGPATARSPSRS